MFILLHTPSNQSTLIDTDDIGAVYGEDGRSMVHDKKGGEVLVHETPEEILEIIRQASIKPVKEREIKRSYAEKDPNLGCDPDCDGSSLEDLMPEPSEATLSTLKGIAAVEEMAKRNPDAAPGKFKTDYAQFGKEYPGDIEDQYDG